MHPSGRRVPSHLVAAGLVTAGALTVLTACSGSAPSAGRAAASSPGAAGSPVGQATGRTITATGTGRAEGSPDLLTVTIGVQTNGATAQGTLADNNAKAQALIAKLKADGVADKDLQTSQLQVSPNYALPTPNSQPRILGYAVTDLVTAKLRDLAKAGTLIDNAVASAGDAARVDGISYSIDDASALLAAARADAVRQAQARAKTMADAAGVGVGQVRTITDLTQSPSPMYSAAPAASAGSSAVPLQAGTEQLSVQVSVVVDIA